MSIAEKFRKAAEPAWAKVPASMKALLDRVEVEAFDISGGFAGACQWPESSLKDEFSRADPSLLAGTALVLSRYALWNPDRTLSERGNGGWFKFVNYADQTLRVRHGLPEADAKYEDQWGMGLSVYEGLARVEFDVREKWGFYSYIGLATDKAVAAIRGAVWPRFPGRDEHPQERGEWVQRCLRTAERLCREWRPSKGGIALIFDTGCIDGHPARENITPVKHQAEKTDGSARRAEKPASEAAGRTSLFGGEAAGAAL
jgi:hypothetical protein